MIVSDSDKATETTPPFPPLEVYAGPVHGRDLFLVDLLCKEHGVPVTRRVVSSLADMRAVLAARNLRELPFLVVDGSEVLAPAEAVAWFLANLALGRGARAETAPASDRSLATRAVSVARLMELGRLADICRQANDEAARRADDVGDERELARVWAELAVWERYLERQWIAGGRPVAQARWLVEPPVDAKERAPPAQPDVSDWALFSIVAWLLCGRARVTLSGLASLPRLAAHAARVAGCEAVAGAWPPKWVPLDVFRDSVSKESLTRMVTTD